MKTAAEVIAMGNDSNVHFKTFQAAAKEVLGEDCPDTKAEILEALEAMKAPEAEAQDEKLFEVEMLRKYAPMGRYAVEDDGVWHDYHQVEEGNTFTVAPGRTVRLPKAEANRAIKMKIATVTERTFD